jgi:hypothetical protein
MYEITIVLPHGGTLHVPLPVIIAVLDVLFQKGKPGNLYPPVVARQRPPRLVLVSRRRGRRRR